MRCSGQAGSMRRSRRNSGRFNDERVQSNALWNVLQVFVGVAKKPEEDLMLPEVLFSVVLSALQFCIGAIDSVCMRHGIDIDGLLDIIDKCERFVRRQLADIPTDQPNWDPLSSGFSEVPYLHLITVGWCCTVKAFIRMQKGEWALALSLAVLHPAHTHCHSPHAQKCTPHKHACTVTCTCANRCMQSGRGDWNC